MQIEELSQFLKCEFPQLNDEFEIVQIGNGYCILQFEADEKHLRPGGTVSGPALFALAVTTNLNINFLRKPAPGLIQGNAKILKLGKRLAIVEISITARENDQLVAHAIATYSLPPR
ncbi:PaaI family thioesterase [Falsochrobactrum ovis]|nr:PaaI family thioesterase [Falsochrobactrum ovis]